MPKFENKTENIDESFDDTDTIVESDETFDDADTTDESVVDNNQTINSSQDQTTKEQTIDSTYNFEQTTIIIALQILPATAQLERQVLLSAGIKGEPPIISSTTLSQIEQVEEFANILSQLKQALPVLAEKAKQRVEKQRQNIPQRKQSQRVATTPELPQSTSTLSQPSSQLSLF